MRFYSIGVLGLRTNRILIAISNPTTFYAIKNDIVKLRDKNEVDLVIINSYGAEVVKTMERILSDHKLRAQTLDTVSKRSYKILLEPYPIITNINAEFRIRFEYGVTPAYVKPNPVYSPEWNLLYDAVLCYSHIAADILSACTRPYIIKPLQFSDFKPHRKVPNVTNLLILFTWGDVSATQKLSSMKERLGKRYRFIVKAHHGIEYLPEYKNAIKELKSVADEYYDASTNVNELFSLADIVVTDNSSAVFTAIYLGIPAVIFTEANSEYHNLNGIKAAHFSLLIEPKRVPFTSKISEVCDRIEEASTNIINQNKLKNELFPASKTTLVDVVELYKNIDRSQEPYYIIRDMILNKIKLGEEDLLEQKEMVDVLKKRNDVLEQRNEDLIKQIKSYNGVKQSIRLVINNTSRYFRQKRGLK